jgi:hypothetical protein
MREAGQLPRCHPDERPSNIRKSKAPPAGSVDGAR